MKEVCVRRHQWRQRWVCSAGS